ncbi:hypothetical protein QQF64_018554 [Cirrhinus molitorella]|uniref:Uncharacterized protein n=1 Tax=Cirrhinus molitorella TaxID=172907 RepID=A0ABR3LGX5_9TELE
MSLERVEQTVKDLKDKLIEHEGKIEKAEDRISMVEDTTVRHQRALRYLLHRKMSLAAKNGHYDRKGTAFTNVKAVRLNSPPRSIIVRFLDAGVKDAIIRQAWSQGQIHFQER